MITCIADAQDYVGGKPTTNYVMVVDALGRWTQSTLLPGLTGINISGVFSTQTSKFGLFGAAPVVQQALLAALSVALTSADADDSTVIALALNSVNQTVNSINTYLQRFGAEASA